MRDSFASSVIFLVAACCGFALRYDVWAAARYPLEERVYSRCGAGRSRRRARGDGVLVWSGVASPVFVGARFWVSSFERGRERHFPSVGRSLAPLVCKKGRVFIRLNRQTWWLLLRDPLTLRPRRRPQFAPPSSQCASCAFPSCFRAYCTGPRSARALPSLAAVRFMVSLDRGSRVLSQVASGNK